MRPWHVRVYLLPRRDFGRGFVGGLIASSASSRLILPPRYEVSPWSRRRGMLEGSILVYAGDR
jgi:hypothetical protein